MVWEWCALYFLTWKFASRPAYIFRHVNFQNGPNVRRLHLLYFEMCFTARNFSSLIWLDGSAPAALANLLFDPTEPQIIGTFPAVHIVGSLTSKFPSIIYAYSISQHTIHTANIPYRTMPYHTKTYHTTLVPFHSRSNQLKSYTFIYHLNRGLHLLPQIFRLIDLEHPWTSQVNRHGFAFCSAFEFQTISLILLLDISHRYRWFRHVSSTPLLCFLLSEF